MSWCSHYINQYGDFTELKTDIQFGLAIPLLGIYTNERNLHRKDTSATLVYRNSIHNSRDMGTTQLPINRRIHKDILYEILLSHKKEQNLTICNKMGLAGNHYA